MILLDTDTGGARSDSAAPLVVVLTQRQGRGPSNNRMKLTSLARVPARMGACSLPGALAIQDR
jgi:hypothetical protein